MLKFIKKHSKVYMILSICLLIGAIGISYAYYAASVSNDTEVVGIAGGGSLPLLTISRISTEADGNLIPIDMDTTTLTKAASRSPKCIDNNGYSACQIYSVTVQNNSNVPQSYNVNLTSLFGTKTPNVDAVSMGNSDNEVTKVSSIKNNGLICRTNSVTNGQTTTPCYFMVLIKNIALAQTDNGTFNGTVTITSTAGAELKADFGAAVKMTSFTINGTKYNSEINMTWRQWLQSDYNTKGYIIDSTGTKIIEPMTSKFLQWTDTYTAVSPDEVITDNVYAMDTMVYSVEQLQEMYDFTYYSTMNAAVNDVNTGTIGATDDAEKGTAVAGVYTDENGIKNVVLLKDHTENAGIELSIDMNINLAGNILTLENDYLGISCIKDNSNTIEIDGRISGSAIVLNGIDGGGILLDGKTNTLILNGGTYILNETVSNNEYSAVVVATSLGGTLNASNCSIIVNSASDGFSIMTKGNLIISNCDLYGTSTSGIASGIQNKGSGIISDCNFNLTGEIASYGIINLDNGIATISDCDIRTSGTGDSSGVYNSTLGEATISNCDIRAYSDYTYGTDSYYGTISIGVQNNGTMTINDCYVIGTHSGVQSRGPLTVNGGTYEGYGHGGFYFAADGVTSYVRDAVIRDCAMPAGYTATANRNGAGFYIGSSNNQNVYMDNCEIYGLSDFQTIAIAGSYGAHDNTLYISNSTIKRLNGKEAGIRIDDAGNKLYIGVGNNFTAEDTSLPEAVVVTDEVYIKK